MYDKNASDLKKIIYFYVIWNHLKKSKNIRWRKLTSFFDKYKFDEAILKIENKYNIVNNQLTIEISSLKMDLSKTIQNKVDKTYNQLMKVKINAIIYDNFNKYEALKNIKNAYFLFFKGDEKILEKKISEFVSVVGSRETPHHYYSKWISKYVPKNKIIISGLANGADTMGHLNAIENNQKIVVFPGTDLFFSPKKNVNKRKIWNYALKNGIIISDIFPGTKSFDKNVFLKRNKWMAQMVNETYAVYFDGISGTLGQLLEVAKSPNGIVYMPKNVYDKNENFLRNHKSFNIIIDKVLALSLDLDKVKKLHTNEIYNHDKEKLHFKNHYIYWYDSKVYYKSSNGKNIEYLNLLKFRENNLFLLQKLQENIFFEKIDELINENTLIILPPIKNDNSPLKKLFEKKLEKYQLLLINSPSYEIKSSDRKKRIEKIRKISLDWTLQKKPLINIETNFLFIDDIYTTGATLIGIIEFIEKTLYKKSSNFRRIEDCKNHNKKYIYFDKITSLIFCRTKPNKNYLQYICIDEENICIDEESKFAQAMAAYLCSIRKSNPK